MRHESDLPPFRVSGLWSHVSGLRLRLIEVNGIDEATGTVIPMPHEQCVAEDRRDCSWLYVVTDCDTKRKLVRIKDTVLLEWYEATKVSYDRLSTDAMPTGR